MARQAWFGGGVPTGSERYRSASAVVPYASLNGAYAEYGGRDSKEFTISFASWQTAKIETN